VSRGADGRGRVVARARIRLESLDRAVLEGLVDGDDDETPRTRGDVGILPWFEDERPISGLMGLLDWRRDGSLSSLARQGIATGTRGETVLLPAGDGLPVERLVLLGCGSLADFDADAASEVGSRVAQIAGNLHPRSVMIGMPAASSERDVLEALFLGMLRGIEDAAARMNVQPEAVLTTPTHPWWVVVESRHIGRLRRLLDGPLRPAVETTSSS